MAVVSAEPQNFVFGVQTVVTIPTREHRLHADSVVVTNRVRVGFWLVKSLGVVSGFSRQHFCVRMLVQPFYPGGQFNRGKSSFISRWASSPMAGSPIREPQSVFVARSYISLLDRYRSPEVPKVVGSPSILAEYTIPVPQSVHHISEIGSPPRVSFTIS